MVEEQTVEVPRKPRLFRRLAWYRRRIASLEQQTALDELTGLRNQRALWRELSRRSQLCSPSHPLALIMVDFDVFREINESYGHVVGDAVLRRAAGVLRSAADSPRLAFRYGGEEFVVLAEADEDEGVELAERIRADITKENGSLPAVTASCGVAAFTESTEPWVVLDLADHALLHAKRAGRNRVAVTPKGDAAADGFLMEDIEHETARRAAMAMAIATLEVRDTQTAHHSDDVVRICEAVGRRLGLDGRALGHLRAGAQLHDVGKVAIPSSILNKPSALTEDEWDLIREHTIMGERILRSVPEMAEVATIVRHSHEHWDGTGYPDGLAGERIPLASRVILCADAFHAIRADRPYRRGRSAHDAVAEIKACAGSQFDPDVVTAFFDVVEEARAGHTGARTGWRPNKRLVVLLTTLVIGSGSAIASIPEVRNAIKSVFATSTPPSHAAPSAIDAGDFGLGPLGDLLRLDLAADRRQKRSEPGQRRGSSKTEGRSAERAAKPAPPRAAEIRDSAGRGSPAPDKTKVTVGTPSPPQTQADDGTSIDPAPTNGRGRALGRDVPTPRPPAESPSNHPGGRTDPPALGRDEGPAPQANGKAKGH